MDPTFLILNKEIINELNYAHVYPTHGKFTFHSSAWNHPKEIQLLWDGEKVGQNE